MQTQFLPLNPILTEVTRSGKTESFHRGSVVFVGPEGRVHFSAGDPERFVFPRSALKMFQALPFILSGAFEHYQLKLEHLALLCASHNSEAIHIQLVRDMLQKGGISEDFLSCGPHEPMDKETAHLLIKTDSSPEQIHNNCSGKHSGFLLLAKYLNAPLEGYLEFDHPVQVLVRKTVAQMFGLSEAELHYGIDGCSAPNYGVPLKNLAYGAAMLSPKNQTDQKLKKACEIIIEAMTKFPHLVAGNGRYCTDLMTACGREVIGKVGAQGVYLITFFNKGFGCAIKMDDGTSGPQYAVAQEMICRSGLFQTGDLLPLEKYRKSPVLNCRKIQVGEMTPHVSAFNSFTGFS